MKLRILLTCAAFSLAAVAATGCDSKKEGTPASGEKTPSEAKPSDPKPSDPKPAAAAGPLAGFDAKAELAHLNGKWNVKTRFGQKAPTVWTVKDGKLTAVDGDKTTESTLKMDFPGRIGVVTKDGGGTSSSYYSYTRNG